MDSPPAKQYIVGVGTFSLKRLSLPAVSTVAISMVLVAAVCLSFAQASGIREQATVRSPAAPGSKTPTTRKAEPEFAVASYNINYGNADLKTVAETIRKADADLVCLQETNRASQKYLLRSLGSAYRYSLFRGGNRRSDGFGFLSKTPIRKPRRLASKFKYFDTWFCTVKLGEKDVRIVNLHLRPINSRGIKSVGQALKRMAAAELWRMKEIAYIHSAIPQKTPVIVTGDFNATPTMASATYLTDRGFVDSFAAVNADHINHVTWRWKHKGVLWRYRLDYIFATKDIQPCTSRIIKSDASDHYLVTSGFRWPEKAESTTRPAEVK